HALNHLHFVAGAAAEVPFDGTSARVSSSMSRANERAYASTGAATAAPANPAEAAHLFAASAR
ncbi:MAG: hypothetical protein LC659_02390, partial [Myxococcales bacterium]|nr:hypothetical protein [Myxococcales bacterium]